MEPRGTDGLSCGHDNHRLHMWPAGRWTHGKSKFAFGHIVGTGNVAAENVPGAYYKKVSKRYSPSTAAPIDSILRRILYM
jgi:hypothetical protein